MKPFVVKTWDFQRDFQRRISWLSRQEEMEWNGAEICRQNDAITHKVDENKRTPFENIEELKNGF